MNLNEPKKLINTLWDWCVQNYLQTQVALPADRM